MSGHPSWYRTIILCTHIAHIYTKREKKTNTTVERRCTIGYVRRTQNSKSKSIKGNKKIRVCVCPLNRIIITKFTGTSLHTQWFWSRIRMQMLRKKFKPKIKAMNDSNGKRGSMKEKRAEFQKGALSASHMYYLRFGFFTVTIIPRIFCLESAGRCRFRRSCTVAGKIDKFNYDYKPNDMILIATVVFYFDYLVPGPWYFPFVGALMANVIFIRD